MNPQLLHFFSMFAAAIGVLSQVAAAAQVVPGPVGVYAGITLQVLGLLGHAFNTPNATTPPPPKT